MVFDRLRGLMTSEGLKARCARGGAALALGTIVERGARLVRNMILARLLAPDQFGLMAIVLAASGLFEAITEIGIRQAVIQNPRGDRPEFLNVAWWISAVRGALVCVVGCLAAPYVARFYGDVSLTPLLQVVMLSMFIGGLTNPRLAVLEKQLRFGPCVWITQGSGLAATVISLVAAVYVRSVWALVLGVVAEAFIRTVLSYVAFPFRPRLSIDRDSWRDLVAFARGMAGLSLLTCVVLQADVFVLGRVCSKEQLGMYSLALALANMPLMVFSRVVAPMVLPVLSDVQGDRAKLCQTVLSITRMLFDLGAPLAAFLVVFGRSILSLAYGKSYGAVSDVFGVLCVYVLTYMAANVLVFTYLAIARPELQRRFLFVWACLVAMAMYPAVKYLGPLGAALTLLVTLLAATAVQLARMARIIGLAVVSYLAIVRRGVAVAALAAIPAVGIRMLDMGAESTQLVLGGLVCALAWALCLLREAGKARAMEFRRLA